MGVRAALVDRAYLKRKRPDVKKVNGATVFVEDEGPPIRCRLTMNQPGERREDGRVFTEPTPTLLLYHRDEERNPVEVKSSDRMRVVSEELGEDIYEVQGEVQPGRKKRRIIVWQATLKRIEENESRRP